MHFTEILHSFLDGSALGNPQKLPCRGCTELALDLNVGGEIDGAGCGCTISTQPQEAVAINRDSCQPSVMRGIACMWAGLRGARTCSDSTNGTEQSERQRGVSHARRWVARSFGGSRPRRAPTECRTSLVILFCDSIATVVQWLQSPSTQCHTYVYRDVGRCGTWAMWDHLATAAAPPCLCRGGDRGQNRSADA